MIPESAIEAACRAEFSDWDTNGDEWWRGMTRKRMHKALEAAAPHMLAPRTYSLEDVAAEFGIDLDELRNAAD